MRLYSLGKSKCAWNDFASRSIITIDVSLKRFRRKKKEACFKHASSLWRRQPDLNWWSRFCRPVPYHLAMPPKKWSGKRDSNSRPSPWQGDALPLSHFRKWCPEPGSNQPHVDFQSTALPTELSGHTSQFILTSLWYYKLI